MGRPRYFGGSPIMPDVYRLTFILLSSSLRCGRGRKTHVPFEQARNAKLYRKTGNEHYRTECYTWSLRCSLWYLSKKGQRGPCHVRNLWFLCVLCNGCLMPLRFVCLLPNSSTNLLIYLSWNTICLGSAMPPNFQAEVSQCLNPTSATRFFIMLPDRCSFFPFAIGKKFH